MRTERRLSVVTWLFFFIGLISAVSQDGISQCRLSDGCTCDLQTSLINISHAFDYPVKNIADSSNPDDYSYQFSPCVPLTQCGNAGVQNESAAVCQIFSNTSYDPVVVGLISSTFWTVESDSLFTISYTGGDMTFDGFKRQAQVHFTLDQSTKSNSIVFLGEKRNNLDKVINYHFQVTIGGGGQTIAGVVGFSLIAAFIVIVSLYLIIGSAYNYTTKNARGVEVIPNYHFWNDFPYLVKDGCCFVIIPCKICVRKNGYEYDAYHPIKT